MTPADPIERTVAPDVPPAHIRDWLRAALLGWERGDLADVAELLVTELVVNARRHGAPPVTVRALPTGAGVRIEVADAGSGAPRVLDPTLGDQNGRGLVVVDALASRWGCDPTDHGKVVWVEAH